MPSCTLPGAGQLHEVADVVSLLPTYLYRKTLCINKQTSMITSRTSTASQLHLNIAIASLLQQANGTAWVSGNIATPLPYTNQHLFRHQAKSIRLHFSDDLSKVETAHQAQRYLHFTKHYSVSDLRLTVLRRRRKLRIPVSATTYSLFSKTLNIQSS